MTAKELRNFIKNYPIKYEITQKGILKIQGVFDNIKVRLDLTKLTDEMLEVLLEKKAK